MLLRPWRLLVVMFVVVLVALGAYLGWLLRSTEQALGRASQDGHALRAAVTAGDDAAIRSAVARLHHDAAVAERRTGGPGWSLLSAAPWFGDDARGVRAVSQAAYALSRGSLVDLATQTGYLNSVLPSGGRVDLAKLRALAPTVADGYRTVSNATDQLERQNPAGFVEALKLRYRDLETQVSQARSALQAADTALQVMPAMLGQDGLRHYLLVLQNNAEIRATGGLPGAVSELEARDGKVSMVKQVAGSELGRATDAVLPASNTEQNLYGDQLTHFFLDANFTPDFPRAADLMRARWREVEGSDVDGVISLDPVALSYLLGATGPVTVQGIQLTEQNAVDELLHGTYLRLQDPAAQDAFFRDVARTIFERLTSGVSHPQQVVAALRRAATEHRLLVHDFTPSLQQRLAGTTVAGELLKHAPGRPQVGVYLNDATGAKMSYYLRYHASVASTYCTGGVQGLAGHLTIGSTAPKNAASLPAYITGGGVYGIPPGQQVVSVMVFGPPGGTLGRVVLGGLDDPEQVTYDLAGRPVTKVWARLAPGQTEDFTWTMTSAKGQTASTLMSMTPSIVPGNSSSTVASTCG